MAVHTVASVLGLLRDSQLLRPEELRALDALGERIGSPSELIRAAHKHGWLTAYQVQELFAGRGGELLLGDYVIRELLGEGSTARIFKAHHRPVDRMVVLKVYRPELHPEVVVDRLRCEHRAGVQLNHP